MAQLSTAERNNLPDSAFAYIEPGGTKDSGGKTTPRSLRHFPIHDAAHVRDALARIAQGAEFGDQARPKVVAAAHKFGIDVSEHESSSRLLELRRRRRGSMVRKLERRGMALEMRAKPNGSGGTEFVFEGYGATFDDPFDMWDPWGDPYTEIVRPGAFAESLGRQGLDVPFLIGHNDQGIPLARTRNGTMQLAEDTRGLHVRAVMDGARSDVRNLASAVERGDLDEMSIGFVTEQQRWSDDYMTREMLGLNIHRGDVSAVALAANPATAGAAMFAMPGEAASRWRPAESRADASGAGDTLHPPFTGTHTHGHPSFSAAEDGAHEHAHDHSGDASHDHHAATTDDADSDGMAPTVAANPVVAPDGRARPHLHEVRAADDASGEIADVSDSADYNPGATSGALCVNPQCSAPGAAATCPQCGGPLYNEDGTIVLDDSGVIEEVGGAMADADLLSRRLRLLELA